MKILFKKIYIEAAWTIFRAIIFSSVWMGLEKIFNKQ
jgi:hypothetical protein